MTTIDERVQLTTLWETGLEEIPDWVFSVLRTTLQQRPGKIRWNGKAILGLLATRWLFAKTLQRWSSVTRSLPIAGARHWGWCRAERVYRQLELCDIQVTTNSRNYCGIKYRNEAQQIGEYRWPYYTFAFFVWQLLYILSTTHMQNPERVWQNLARLISCTFDKLGTSGLRNLYLALYERMWGIVFDMNNRLPHYDHNIVYRTNDAKNRSTSPNEERVTAFTNLVHFLMQKLEQQINILR